MREKGTEMQFLWAIYYRIRESLIVEILEDTQHKFSVEGNQHPGWNIRKKGRKTVSPRLSGWL